MYGTVKSASKLERTASSHLLQALVELIHGACNEPWNSFTCTMQATSGRPLHCAACNYCKDVQIPCPDMPVHEIVQLTPESTHNPGAHMFDYTPAVACRPLLEAALGSLRPRVLKPGRSNSRA